MAPSRRKGSNKDKAAIAAAKKKNWNVGDLVLAKVKGFPAWPATVSEPEKWGYSADLKKVLVYFFGTKQMSLSNPNAKEQGSVASGRPILDVVLIANEAIEYKQISGIRGLFCAYGTFISCSAFCNPADVEAFTEEKKKSLLTKRQGKGADFVRAVQEIVDCYEKSKAQARDNEVNSGDECTISNAGNLEDSICKLEEKNQPEIPDVVPSSRLESSCVPANSNVSPQLTDFPAEMEKSGVHCCDTVSEEPGENISSPDNHRSKNLVPSDSLRKSFIEAPLQGCIVQKRTAVRRCRSTVKVQTEVTPFNNSSTNTCKVLSNGLRNESSKRSRRSRKSPGSSVWHNMESPGCSTAFASNISSEDNGSDLGTSNSDTISNSGGNTLESTCKSEQAGIDGECLDRGVQLSDQLHLPVETVVFKKKRKPNKKRVAEGAASPKKGSGLDAPVNKTSLISPNACENLFNHFSRTNGDEHLPLVKRARVRMGTPPSEEKQLNEKVDDAEEESSKEVLTSNAETQSSISCGSNVFTRKTSVELKEDVNGSSAPNGFAHTERKHIWNAKKHQLRGSVDGEAALPPSKRLHRALEAMSANAAEEIQTFFEVRGTSKFMADNSYKDSSEKSSATTSVGNEVGIASAVYNGNSFGGNDANVESESGLLPGLNYTSEVLVKSSLEPKSCDSLVECSMTLQADEFKEMILDSKTSMEVENADNLSVDTYSGETKDTVRSPRPSSFKPKQGIPGSCLESMDLLSPTAKREKHEFPGSSHGSLEDSANSEHAFPQEDKLAQEHVTSQLNNQRHDSSEVNEAGFSLSGDGARISFGNVDCKNMQSLISPLDKNTRFRCEVVKEDNFKPAEQDRDEVSMRVSDVATQTKRHMSLSTPLSDNVLDEKVVCESLSSPSVSRVGSYEHVSPPSTTCPQSTVENGNPVLHSGSGSQEVLPHYKKSTRVLEIEEVGILGSSFSRRQKSLGKWTNTEANEVRKSFESVLGTLSRTKESIGRATRHAMDCAKYGIAGEVLEILVRNLENESSLRKRVDLFFLVDSITQCSRGQKGDVSDIYPSAVQAMLPRLLSAVAPPGSAARENRKQCLKASKNRYVLKLWLERKTLPESVIRHHMRELDSESISSRRPLRIERALKERALNDPIREMEGMHVDEYGSNASFQIPGFCMSRMMEDEEGSDAEDRSFEAVTPEQDPEVAAERGATPSSAIEKHCHILEDVDGELEMEDVAPSYEVESSAYDVSGANNAGTSHRQFEQRLPLTYAPPLPEYCPPSPPPLPASPPPLVPPPPTQSVTCHPFTDSVDLKLHTDNDSMQNPSQHMPRQSDARSLSSVASEKVQYHAPGYRDLGKQSLRPGYFSSSSSCRRASSPRPSVHTRNNVQHTNGATLHNKSYHLQPPPPRLSNQFSYVQADQRRQSWMEASSSFTRRYPYGHDRHREDMYENGERMDFAPHDIGERYRMGTPVHSGPVQSDNHRASYAPNSHYGPPMDSTRILDRGWSFPPRTSNYHNPRPFRPPEGGFLLNRGSLFFVIMQLPASGGQDRHPCRLRCEPFLIWILQLVRISEI
ncbi:hypothetical protein IFM89_009130 [Coptis chinensis]|uniref:PWWP domain-containing protein n=1 Tax=Coptis chinensis TaxID=261450 RepID=A0A835HSS2_9MAGN|nr:hypothetical protein IFM89_009130 [Coptis chinensis]